jgi:hypothetical protein
MRYMKWISRFFLSILGLLTIGAVRDFFSKHEIVIVDKEDIIKENQEEWSQFDQTEESELSPMDLRGEPAHICLCGSQIWNVKVIFSDYEIATYFLDMECVNCGSIATAPTPIDTERME